MKNRALAAIAVSCAISGCAGAGAGFDGFWGDLCGTPPVYSYRSVSIEEMPAFPRTCLANDPLVADFSQCVEGGVHCYQLDTGNWCAGPYSPFVLEPAFHAGIYGWSK